MSVCTNNCNSTAHGTDNVQCTHPGFVSADVPFIASFSMATVMGYPGESWLHMGQNCLTWGQEGTGWTVRKRGSNLDRSKKRIYSPHLSACYWTATNAICPESKADGGVKLTTHFLLVPKLGMRGSTPPSFMSWTGQFYLHTVITLTFRPMHAIFVAHLLWLLQARLPAKRLTIHDDQDPAHTNSPWHSQPASSISLWKKNTQWRSTEASSTRSLHSKCQTVLRFTCECNFILSNNSSTAFSLYRMCTKLTNAQRHCVQTGYAEFQQNRSVNVGRVDRHCELWLSSYRFFTKPKITRYIVVRVSGTELYWNREGGRAGDVENMGNNLI